MKHSVRNWHKWVSVILAVPLILVGLTTVFIAHDKALGTRDLRVPIGGLVREEADEVRAQQMIGDSLWLGTRAGVYTQALNDAASLQPRSDAPADEIRGIAQHGEQVLLAGKQGLWRMSVQPGAAPAEQIWKGDCWQLSGQGGRFFASCKNAVLRSVDGLKFEKVPLALAPIRHAENGVSLQKLIMDIHTGKLFFGKDGEWIWIDVLGLTMVGLGLTGLLMWMRSRRQRAGLDSSALDLSKSERAAEPAKAPASVLPAAAQQASR